MANVQGLDSMDKKEAYWLGSLSNGSRYKQGERAI